jgi:hypothetical protein
MPQPGFNVEFFLRIGTDQGPHGIAGPLPEMVATYVARRLRMKSRMAFS